MAEKETTSKADPFVSNQCLLLFSGGKDSFLTACRLVEQGYDVQLISFNNGALAAEKNLLHGAARLKNRYGEKRVDYVGVYNTASVIMRLTEKWADTPYAEIAAKYPSIVNAQLACLHCQTAMWLAAIAYAKEKYIDAIACGYRKSDLFCTGIAGYVSQIRKIAGNFNVGVMTPVWDATEWDEHGGFARDTEMMSHLFMPSVLEPKCMIGRPVKPMSEADAASMMEYFSDNLSRLAIPIINKLRPIFRTIKLSSASPQELDYEVPDPCGGVY